MINLSLLFTGFFVLSLHSVGQHCATQEHTKMLQDKNVIRETTETFENWIKTQIKKKRSKRQEAEVVNIPVVVHIIHNGAPEGFGINLPEAQIISQIEVLNEDFRRLNDDRINTPDEFLPVAADIELTFSLAARDPEGLPSNGIVRVDGGKDLWFVAEDYALKSNSFWPSEDYLNIWVTDLGDGFLGYAQFPVSPLEGLEDGSNSRLTDGIVVDYRAFGSILKYPAADLNPKYNLGRTTSHEIGHYFGLRHIWGDGNCSQDDFCADTPPQNSDNNGLSNCTYPGKNTCSSDNPNLADMFQNYMDYTNDVCMNLFTQDQKTRMRTVLDNSPRRVSLKASLGDEAPVLVANDLGIRKVVSPTFSVCGDTFNPKIEVRNYGTNSINVYEVQALLNNLPVASFTSNEVIGLLEIQEITFDEIAVPIDSEAELSFEVVSVNNGTDGNAENDLLTEQLIIPIERVSLTPLSFSQFPLQWSIFNNDDLETWEPFTDELNNNSLYMNFYDYENEGAVDVFSSPSFSLSRATSAELVFDVAFAKYPQIDLEGLMVVISEQCGNPLTSADTLYYKLGNELATVNSTSASFAPTDMADWRQERISLASYIGLDALQLSFIGINGFGNNLYIDNIAIQNVENRIVTPSAVSCNAEQNLTLEIVNTNDSPLLSYNLSYVLDDNAAISIDNLLPEPLQPGFSTMISTPLGILEPGIHNLSIDVTLPGVISENKTHQFYIDDTDDVIPIRETMDNLEISSWIIVNNDQDITWEPQTEGLQNFLSIDNGDYVKRGEKDWFVSPNLDFSNTSTAILTFDMAYSSEVVTDDRLEVLISTDCGETFEFTEFVKVGQELITSAFTEFPSLSDWRTETIDLSGYTGFSDVRIAFVSINQNGNSLFLDDIQVFVTDFIDQTSEVIFPNPTIDGEFNLKFDLNRKESLQIVIYNSAGQPLKNISTVNTLNQVYTFDISSEPPGVYIVKIVGETFATSRRLLKTF